ncbi:hypothetical protein [Pleionea litopenaei]|uniref:Uncharacterized protein n=1 Tax=Pleionea litopenaei TaxID=3070815 RepID=A0AA51X7H7_9GAMM|nr:hypothetical protein [Pleionea sp. HL-JVS1]WMS87896.1 hypothetical protein Q9312_02995 [Pleionea sp. HL-JVS1]
MSGVIKPLHYSNRTNKTKKLEKLKKEEFIDDNHSDDEKLITIKAFINVIDLMGKATSTGEKILLNLVFLLIVTGFRSIECITLRKDALVKRPIVDVLTKEQLIKQGQPQYSLGIKYIGAKGTGERIHWVEPLAVPLVEAIFDNTLKLSEKMRKKIEYLRVKSQRDYLPESLDNIPSTDIEIGDTIENLITTECSRPGIGSLRDRLYKAFNSARLPISKELRPGKKYDIERYYSKVEINRFIASKYGEDANAVEQKLTYRWSTSGKKYEIKYEDLLFIHEFGSTKFARKQILTAVVIPFSNPLINNFLGFGGNKSAFEYYNLIEDDGSYTRLKSHMPRHNINTFLAIAGLSEHLQAMLMGRIDITQNEHYQHVAIKHIRKATSLISLATIPKSNSEISEKTESKIDSSSPIDYIRNNGFIKINPEHDLEANLKTNLHTFDNREDIAKHLESTMSDTFLSDVKSAFDEFTDRSKKLEAKELIERHATLHPLPLGSCNRNVAASGCPTRLKCQSGEYCESFELTGRIDEHSKLNALREKLQEQFKQLEQLAVEDDSYTFARNQMSKNLDNLARLERISLLTETKRQIAKVRHYKSEEKVTTLADLFAREHLKGEQNA